MISIHSKSSNQLLHLRALLNAKPSGLHCIFNLHDKIKKSLGLLPEMRWLANKLNLPAQLGLVSPWCNGPSPGCDCDIVKGYSVFVQ